MLYRGSLAAGALAALALPSASSATLLYVTSYAGTVTTLNLTVTSPSAASLQSIATSTECGAQPSWLTLVGPNLYCLDESWGQLNGSLISFTTSPTTGKLTLLDKATTIGGPVSAVVYGQGGAGLAIADYAEAGINTFNIANPADLQPVQANAWVLPQKGPNPDRQEKPHPHQAILDPTGKFLLVPDLGFDRVHVFSLDQVTLKQTELAPLLSPPGSGPRHGVFVKAGEKTLFYVITELSNQIIGYSVTYKADNTLGFTQVYISGTHGPEPVPAGAAGGEIALSPDSKFITVSSRNEASLKIPNFDKTNSTQLASDPLITFSINYDTGALTLVQKFPAGGLVPRHFSFNKAGTLVASAAQKDGRLAIISRDVSTGVLKEYVANIAIVGEVNCAIFAE
ncbi:YkgB protein [Apodospora peruviana]|uniref:YkgB protein n=1 Tax=Apodospora peruviana TaxID=516989 RepID=A0AAE0I4Q7_9PEZI|nr:YkgB protein [Apodospora peruviana]